MSLNFSGFWGSVGLIPGRVTRPGSHPNRRSEIPASNFHELDEGFIDQRNQRYGWGIRLGVLPGAPSLRLLGSYFLCILVEMGTVSSSPGVGMQGGSSSTPSPALTVLLVLPNRPLNGPFQRGHFHHGGVPGNCPLALMGRFPSAVSPNALMGRFPS